MGRYLKQNSSNERPTHIIAVDVESFIHNINDKEKIHTFRLGTYWYLRRNNDNFSMTPGEFFKINEFYSKLDDILLSHRTVYIIGHNMRYDYGILDMDNFLDSREYVIDKFVIEQVFIVSAKGKNNSRIIFIDTKNWFSTSLKRLGKAFGLDKGEIKDFENVTDEELLPYCYNDSKIVAEVVIKFIDFINKHDLGNFSITSASQAFNAYRHRFMREKTIVIHGKSDYYDLEQQTYRGGRTDIFKQGVYYNIYKLDINSMYPFVMRNNDYPIAPLSRRILIKGNIKDLKEYVKKYFVIADCDICLTEPSIAIKRNKLVFPIGNIKNAYLTNPELEYLLSNNSIKTINRYLLYKKENIFSEYVDYFYNIKQNSTGPMKELSKLFLNSLYGKFGQRALGGISEYDNYISRSFFELVDDNGCYFEHETGNKIMKIGDKIYSVSPKLKKPSYNSSPIISSAVTAYARMYLFKLFKICGFENLYYCDTDSIFTNRLGYEKLKNCGYVDNNKLGLLKVEDIGDVCIRGPKDYDWYSYQDRSYKRTIKGIPNNAIQIDDNEYVYDQWVTGLTRYRQPKKKGIMIKEIKKELSRDYDKGIINTDGSVSPLNFNDF